MKIIKVSSSYTADYQGSPSPVTKPDLQMIDQVENLTDEEIAENWEKSKMLKGKKSPQTGFVFPVTKDENEEEFRVHV